MTDIHNNDEQKRMSQCSCKHLYTCRLHKQAFHIHSMQKITQNNGSRNRRRVWSQIFNSARWRLPYVTQRDDDRLMESWLIEDEGLHDDRSVIAQAESLHNYRFGMIKATIIVHVSFDTIAQTPTISHLPPSVRPIMTVH